LIFLAGLITAAALLIVLGFELVGDLRREGRQPDVVKIAEEMVDRTEFSLGEYELVEGWPVVRVELTSEQDYGSGLALKSSWATRNFLFYDYEKDAFHWLVEGNGQLFPWYAEIPAEVYGRKRDPVRAVLYEVVREDTNDDGRLNVRDISALAISDPSGNSFKILIENIGVLKNHVPIGTTGSLVFYEMDETMHVAEIDLVRQEVVKNRSVAGVPGGEEGEP
jgi:hypothetical protein